MKFLMRSLLVLEVITEVIGSGSLSTGAGVNEDDPNPVRSVDYQSISNNTRCSQTQLSLTTESLLHIWEIQGLLGYLNYVVHFDQPLELKTDVVTFKSDNVDGKWIFKLVRNHRHHPLHHHYSRSNTGSKGEVNDNLQVIATYSYEAKQPRKVDFAIYPTLHLYDGKEIVLPPQRSTSSPASIVQQRYYNQRGYQLNSNYFEYVHTFTWTDVIIPSRSPSFNEGGGNHPQSDHWSTYRYQQSEEFLEHVTLSTDYARHFGDVTLRFGIAAYLPADPVSVTSSRCNTSLLNDVVVSTNETAKDNYTQKSFIPGGHVPPYLRYSNSMMHDDRFADVILVVGDEELAAHRIILATSSPVFSDILENTTTHHDPTSAPVCTASGHLPRIPVEPPEIGMEAFRELLRYIYTGAVDPVKVSGTGAGRNLTAKLIIAAEAYKLPELKKHCETSLVQGLCPENAIEMYSLGIQADSPKLARKALAILKLSKAKLVARTEDLRHLSLHHPQLMYELFLSD